MLNGQELTSFYGGTGPVSNLIGKADYRLWLWFEQDFAQWRREHKILSEYVRLHPHFDQQQRRMLRESTIKVEHLREAVTVKINVNDDDLLKSFSRNRQRGLKTAYAAKMWVEESNDVEVFIRLYGASAPKWGYPRDTWVAYRDELAPQYLTFLAAENPDGFTEAVLMILHGYGRAYAHFIGSYNNEGINDLLYFESMKYCRDVGCKTMFLGGGTTSNVDDPLLRYKMGFSKVTVPVSFYRRTFIEAAIKPSTYIESVVRSAPAGQA